MLARSIYVICRWLCKDFSRRFDSIEEAIFRNISDAFDGY